ncbi:MAG: protein kinase, partial [Planctomycetes bacterium]|nr:protein kinase [Planctomycetota bacterium]
MDRRYVRLDPAKLDYLRLKRGWNVETLFSEAAKPSHMLDKRTVKAIINGEPAFLNSAKVVATLLGAEDLVSVLHPELLGEIGPPSGWGSPLEFFATVGEWDVLEPIAGVQKTANGLSYDVWKVRHRHVPGRLGRAKCYDLNRLSTKDRTRLREYLTRHSQVCDRVGAHPHIAQNRSAIAWEHSAMWWVVDEWVEGELLSAVLGERRLLAERIPTLMRQIASGLEALHAAQIIRRELSPRFVIVRKTDGSAVLTDFELAKLLDGAPTVSPREGWPDDDYLAVEVDGDAAIDVRADIYSWGRILVHALCGQLPPKGQEADALGGVELPTAVRRLALSCVALPRSDRPETIAAVLSATKKW